MNNLKNLQLQRKFKLLFNRLSQLEDLMIGNKEINYLDFDKNVFLFRVCRGPDNYFNTYNFKF